MNAVSAFLFLAEWTFLAIRHRINRCAVPLATGTEWKVSIVNDHPYPVRSAEALIRAIISRTTGEIPSSERMGEASWAHPRFTIAISREAGTQAGDVALEIGQRLGWHVFDHELVERVAQDMGLRTSLLDAVDEKHVGWMQETIEKLGSVPAVSETTYVLHLMQTVVTLGAHGHCIIVGRGAAHLLPQSMTLRVRLVAPLEDRVQVMSQRLGISHREAARKVEQLDRERTRFVKEYFHKDPTDPQHYDMLLNMSRISIAESAGIIIAALERLQKPQKALQPLAVTV